LVMEQRGNALNNAKSQFHQLLHTLKTQNEQKLFEEYVFTMLKQHEHGHGHGHGHHNEVAANNNSLEAEGQDRDQKADMISYIIQELRGKLPAIGEAPKEKFFFPNDNPDYQGYNKSNTIHVDSFLYPTDEDIDDLCDRGVLSRNYCVDCGSKYTKPYNFISHSATSAQLKYIFSATVLGDLEGKVLVDVGSRLGAVLYVGHVYSKAAQLVGIEKNNYFCDLQNQMKKRFKMSERIKIIHDDVMNHKKVLSTADVVVMNNVFEFFVPQEQQQQIWQFIRESVCKKGSKLVTIPSLESTLKNNKISLDVDKWVQRIAIQHPVTGNTEEDEDCESVCLYEVL